MLEIRKAFEFAVDNIARWGDTDVFPFAPENHILHDKRSEVVNLLLEIHNNLKSFLADSPPIVEGALALITHEGFRWVSQIDPLWNAYFLGLTLHVSPELEAARLDLSKETVHSYRFDMDSGSAALFRADGWSSFNSRSEKLAGQYGYVVTADIADFYGRLYHHRVENALQLIARATDIPGRINSLLREFSGGPSFGLPVGGSAARALSELALDRVDRLLSLEGVVFCRYADDYRLFADTEAAAFRALVSLTEKLLRHEGLNLQKQKTRVLKSSDFLRSPLFIPAETDEITDEERKEREFLRLSLRFDPYSPTAEDDYERLRRDLDEFDIIQMLSDEVAKSRVNIAMVRRLARAVGLLDRQVQEAAVTTILKSLEMLAPAMPVVLRVLDDLAGNLPDATRAAVMRELRARIEGDEYFICLPLNLTYALRVLRHEASEENLSLAARLFESPGAPFLQRDIVLHMYNWGETAWLSEKRRLWRNQHPWVQRALLLASYGLGDEGAHWRRSASFPPFDKIAEDWMRERVQSNRRDLPL